MSRLCVQIAPGPFSSSLITHPDLIIMITVKFIIMIKTKNKPPMLLPIGTGQGIIKKGDIVEVGSLSFRLTPVGILPDGSAMSYYIVVKS